MPFHYPIHDFRIYLLYLKYPTGSQGIAGVSLEPDSTGALEGIAEFAAESGRTDRIPVAFRLLPQYRTLLYRWIGSDSAIPGGYPTVKIQPLNIGEPVPEMSFVSLGGDTLSTGDFMGSVLVLNWWATTCGPCIAEMPDLNDLVASHEASNEIAFVAVAFDEVHLVSRLLAQHEFEYQQTLGTEDHEAVFGPGFPRHVVVDRKGIVVFDRDGAGPHRKIAGVLDSLGVDR